MNMITSFSSLKGVRDSQEDAHVIASKGNTALLGVFDGHGGSRVSRFLEENIPKYLLKFVFPISKTKITRIFDYIEEKLVKNHKRVANNQGSTCVCVVKSAEHLTCINVGDSRAVLCRDSKVVPLSTDHKPNTKEEKARIKKLGGEKFIKKAEGDDWRIKNLSVSRSFGDLDVVPYVTHQPETKIIPMHDKDQFVLLACDGLWDVMTNKMAVDFVLAHADKKHVVAELLAKEAMQLGTEDNVTVVVGWFR